MIEFPDDHLPDDDHFVKKYLLIDRQYPFVDTSGSMGSPSIADSAELTKRAVAVMEAFRDAGVQFAEFPNLHSHRPVQLSHPMWVKSG